MSTAASTHLAVLLIGLPGFYEALLRREFAADSRITVMRVGNEKAPAALPLDADAVVVVGANARSLRSAAELFGASSRIIGAVAVTDDEPRGDAYLVMPAGTNVSRQELAQVIRDLAAGGLMPPNASYTSSRGLTRSER